jgi:arylsulfatase
MSGERYDVQKEFPEIVKMLETIAEKARQELGDDLQKRTGNEVRLPATIVYQ